MRIGILVNDISLKGGVEVVTVYLAKEFYNNNIPVQIFSIRNTRDTDVNNINMNVYNVKNEITKICQYITNYSITHLIVQLNTPFCIFAEIELYRKLIFKNIKIYMVLHNSPLSFLKRYRNVFDECIFIYILKILKTIVVYNPRVKIFFLELKKLNVSFITLSCGNYYELKKYFGIESYTIYNSVLQKNIVLPKKQDIINKRNYIVFIGRLDERQKGLVFLLDSWKKINRKNWRLLIIGDGPDEENLRKYAHNNKIQDTYFLGWQNRDNVNKILSLSKIFVMTSTHEGFPTVFYEALVNDTVIICTKFDGFSDELIKNNLNALVCKRNRKEFINGLHKLIDDPILLKSFMDNNAIVLSEYNKLNVVEQWLNTFSYTKVDKEYKNNY